MREPGRVQAERMAPTMPSSIPLAPPRRAAWAWLTHCAASSGSVASLSRSSRPGLLGQHGRNAVVVYSQKHSSVISSTRS